MWVFISFSSIHRDDSLLETSFPSTCSKEVEIFTFSINSSSLLTFFPSPSSHLPAFGPLRRFHETISFSNYSWPFHWPEGFVIMQCGSGEHLWWETKANASASTIVLSTIRLKMQKPESFTVFLPIVTSLGGGVNKSRVCSFLQMKTKKYKKLLENVWMTWSSLFTALWITD